MSIRDDLCAQRALAEQLDRDLAAIGARLASRNAAHHVDRARSMARATAELITQTLQQPLDELLPEADAA